MAQGRWGSRTLAAMGIMLALTAAVAGCRQEGADDGEAEGDDLAGDAAITVRVKSSLAVDPRVGALDIDVDTRNGTVTLAGEVDVEEAKSAAEEVARGAEGVVDVVNRITVGGGGEGGDSDVGQGTEP